MIKATRRVLLSLLSILLVLALTSCNTSSPPADTVGENGLNAYELAVQNGFEGTLDEWLDSLKGEPGNDGEHGKDGKDVMNILKDKLIIYDGDSICESRFQGQSDNGGSYPKIISDLTGCAYKNLAVGGGTLCSQKNRPENQWGSKYHSVVDSLEELPKDGDLYCFEGGVNDYWQNFPLGSFDPHDYTGELDTETVSGALEYIFRYALNEFSGKPICFVIVHKISEYADGVRTADLSSKKNGASVPYDFDECHDRLAAICKKYSIPYYDAYEESGLNGWNEIQNNTFLTAGGSCTPGRGDGCHPNAEAYKRYYVPQLISLFERILPKI